MAIQTVFSSNLNPDTGSLSSRFVNATGFYIDAPTITAEIEIDVYLQVYLSTSTGEKVRNLPLGKLKDGEIKLNETDSETIVSIPYEFVDSGLEMALYFVSSDTTFLEAYVVGADCTLCRVQSGVFSLIEEFDNRFNALNFRLTAIESTLSQILTLVSADVVIPGSTPEILFLIS